MMNVNDIKGFHIELTNMCTLKCPGCARTRFIEQWPQHWKNQNLNPQHLFKFLNIDLTNLTMDLCGNYGDPIYHPDLFTFVKEFKKRGALITITTNGSYKTQEWWNTLLSLLGPEDCVMFSIDGLPHNFNQYRINGDWESIKIGLNAVGNSSCKSVWKYIVFSYNENDVDETKKLCYDLGIKDFRLELSDRFDNQTEQFRPINMDLIGERYNKQKEFKQNNILNVKPKCQDNKHHYITATGHYASCCYVSDHRFYYKTEFGKNKKLYDISETTLSELLKTPAVCGFYNNLQNIPACQFNCPA